MIFENILKGLRIDDMKWINLKNRPSWLFQIPLQNPICSWRNCLLWLPANFFFDFWSIWV